MKEKPPPTDCIICHEPNCNDWMYHAGLVPAEQAICGKCKIELGGRMAEKMGMEPEALLNQLLGKSEKDAKR